MKSPAPLQDIVIVSGIPRSGTSMMMQSLVAGGLEAVTDLQRVADDDNPVGYYELEMVKRLPRGSDSFLDAAQGKVVKIIHALLKYLPARHRYRVVFMHRDLHEVAASQRVMLERQGKAGASLSETQLVAILDRQRLDALAWLNAQPNCDLIEVHHAEVVADPVEQMDHINQFLGGGLDAEAMTAAVKPELHRQKK